MHVSFCASINTVTVRVYKLWANGKRRASIQRQLLMPFNKVVTPSPSPFRHCCCCPWPNSATHTTQIHTHTHVHWHTEWTQYSEHIKGVSRKSKMCQPQEAQSQAKLSQALNIETQILRHMATHTHIYTRKHTAADIVLVIDRRLKSG